MASEPAPLREVGKRTSWVTARVIRGPPCSSHCPMRLGLGCAPLGGLYEPVSDDDARATIESAWEAGVRLFDTAPLYGAGFSDRRVGAALRERPRDEYTLSTKVGRLLVPGAPAPMFPGAGAAPRFDFSAEGVRRSLAESLDRLGLDRVDVALIHDPDEHMEQALAETYPALEALRSEGAVREIGVGMNQWQALARFVRETDVDCVLVAGRYTLLDRSADAELLPLCAERGRTVHAAGVFNSGLLAGGATFDYVPASREQLERVRALDATCARWKDTLNAAALQYPLRHHAVADAIVGCRSPSELEENVTLLELPVPDGLWQELDA